MNTKRLVEAIENGGLSPEVEEIFKDSMGGKNPVYIDRVGNVKLQFINSSNQEPLSDFDSLLDEVKDRLEEEELEGEVYDRVTGNQIYFEVVSKGSRGSLVK